MAKESIPSVKNILKTTFASNLCGILRLVPVLSKMFMCFTLGKMQQ